MHRKLQLLSLPCGCSATTTANFVSRTSTTSSNDASDTSRMASLSLSSTASHPSAVPSSAQALHSALLFLAQNEHSRRLFLSQQQQQRERNTMPYTRVPVAAAQPDNTVTGRPTTHPITINYNSIASAAGDVSAAEAEDTTTTTTTLLASMLRSRRDSTRQERHSLISPRHSVTSAGTQLNVGSSSHGVARALRERLQRRRQRSTTTTDSGGGAAAAAAATTVSSSSGSSSLSLAAGSAAVDTSTTSTSTSGATWHTAFQLFTQAIQEKSVTPTAQHFNLLLGLVVQEKLWAQADSIERFYAHFLHSTQELRAEKGRALAAMETATEEERGGSGQANNSDNHHHHDIKDDESIANSSNNDGAVLSTAAVARQRQQQLLRHEASELAAMESSLRPNRQTFHLLMQAAMQRGSDRNSGSGGAAWPLVLEYYDNMADAGIAARDAEVRLVLQACLSGGARTLHPPDDYEYDGDGDDALGRAWRSEEGEEEGNGEGSHGSTFLSGGLTLSPHGTFKGRTRLLTNQRGQQLTSAAWPNAARKPLSAIATTSTTAVAVSLSSREQHQEQQQQPLWMIGMRAFDALRPVVSSPQTMWLVVQLLQDAGGGGSPQADRLLQVYRNYKDRLLPTEVPYDSNSDGNGDAEAVAHVQLAVSGAAREIGEWPLALELWAAAARFWEERFARPSLRTDMAAWSGGGSGGGSSRARGVGDGQQQQQRMLAIINPSSAAVMTARDNAMAAAHREAARRSRRHAQRLLVNALHSLRRVRRYKGIVALYRQTFPPHADSSTATAAGGGGGGDRNSHLHGSRRRRGSGGGGSCARLWTPRAVAFVAQAAMAERDTGLLLELVGLDNSIENNNHHDHDISNDVNSPDYDASAAAVLPPAEAFDAALRALQTQTVTTLYQQQQQQQQQQLSASLASTSQLSRDVYDRFLRVALREVAAMNRHEKPPSSSSDDDDDAARELLTSVHLPVIRMRMAIGEGYSEQQQQQQRYAHASSPLAIAKAALHHLSTVRRPDALLLALVMDVVRRAVEASSDGGSPSSSLMSSSEAATLSGSVVAVFQSLVADAEKAMGRDDGGGGGGGVTDADNDTATARRRICLALTLTNVTAPCVEWAVEALAIGASGGGGVFSGHPFAAITLLDLASRLLWLPPARIAQLQVGLHQQALAAAQRAMERAEADRAAAADAVSGEASEVIVANSGGGGGGGGSALVRESAHGAIGALVALAALTQEQQQHQPHKDGVPHPPPPSTSTFTSSPSVASLVAAAVDVMRLMQANRQHPPTAAVVSLLHTMRAALQCPNEKRQQQQQQQHQLAVAVVVIVNALLQQISVTATSRWALWPQCVEIIQLLESPLVSASASSDGDFEMEQHQQQQQQPCATVQTLQVLSSFVRYSDKAEAGLVEGLALHWLAACNPKQPQQQRDNERVVDRAGLRLASLRLLLDCLVWACRHRDKPLVRRLLSNPVVTSLLFPSAVISGGGVYSSSVSAERFSHSEAAGRALDASVMSALLVVLQCLTSGDHRDVVLRDWPTIAQALRRVHAHCKAATATGENNTISINNKGSQQQVRVAVLIESVAAVLAKLQLSLCFLLRSLSFDAHRRNHHRYHRHGMSSAHSSSSSSDSDSGTIPPTVTPPPPPLLPSAEYTAAVEKAAAEFLSLCESQFVSGLLVPLIAAPSSAAVNAATTQLLFRSALEKSLTAAWEVLFAHYTWLTVFKDGKATTSATIAVAEVSAYARSLLLVEVGCMSEAAAAAATSTASLPFEKHFSMWCVIQSSVLAATASTGDVGGGGSTAVSAVTALCADITTMEPLHGAMAATTAMTTEQRQRRDKYSRNAPNTNPSASFIPKRQQQYGRRGSSEAAVTTASTAEPSFLLRFLTIVDGMTDRLMSANNGSTGAELLPAPAVLFASPESQLDPRLARAVNGGCPATISIAPPLPLQLLHEAALTLLRLALCEGTDGLLAADHSALVGRLLAWPTSLPVTTANNSNIKYSGGGSEGRCTAYTAALQALDGAGLSPVLHSPESIVGILRLMGRTSAWLARCNASNTTTSGTDDLPSGSTTVSSATLLLRFMATSKVYMGVSSLTEDMAAEALLCLAYSPLGPATVAGRQATSLVAAFPSLAMKVMLPRWHQREGAMSPVQQRNLDDWATAVLRRRRDDDDDAVNAASLLPQRAAVVWLLGTRGALLTDGAATATGALGASSSLAAIVRLANSGEEATVNLLVHLTPEQLMSCHHAGNSSSRYQAGQRQRQHQQRMLLFQRLHVPADAEPVRGQDNNGDDDDDDGDDYAAASAVLSRLLTRSTAVQLLRLSFPEETATPPLTAPQQHEQQEQRRCATRDPELQALLSLAGSRLTDAVRAAVEQTNALRLSQQRILAELECSAHQQQQCRCSSATVNTNGATASAMAPPVSSPGLPAARIAAIIQKHQSSGVAHAVVAAAVMREVVPAGISEWPEASQWLLESVDAVSSGHILPSSSSPLAVVEGYLLALVISTVAAASPATNTESEAFSDFLITALHASGRSAATVVFTRIYPLLLRGGKADTGTAAGLQRRVSPSLRLLLSLYSSGSGSRGNGATMDEMETAVLCFGLRRVTADYALNELLFPASASAPVASNAGHASASDVLPSLLSELQRCIGERIATTALSPSTSPSLAAELAMRAWVQSSVLLGSWKGLGYLAERMNTNSNISGNSFNTSSITALATAAAIASLARPQTSASSGTGGSASLERGLRSSLARCSPAFARIARRQPTRLERLVLSAPLLTAAAVARRAGGAAAVAALSPGLLSDVDLQRLVSWVACRSQVVMEEDTGAVAAVDPPAVAAGLPTPCAIEDAVHTLTSSSPEAFAAFIRLESLYGKRNSSAGFAAPEDAEEQQGTRIQEAWRCLTAAVATRPTTPTVATLGIDRPTLMRLFHSLGAIPHTRHFIPAALSEAVVQYGCDTFADALAALAFSASTLTRGGGGVATPVQQYIAYLIVKRLRLSVDVRGGGDAQFHRGLDAYRHVILHKNNSNNSSVEGSSRQQQQPQQQPSHSPSSSLSSSPCELWQLTDNRGDLVARVSPGSTKTGMVAVVCACVAVLSSNSHNSSSVQKSSSVGSGLHTPPPLLLLPQLALTELLRASTADAEVALFLYECLWRQGYRRLEGVNPFLSLLRTANACRDEPLALLAMRDFLSLLKAPHNSNRNSSSSIGKNEEMILPPSMTADGGGAWEATSLPPPPPPPMPHTFSQENCQMLWKAFSAACRAGVVGEAAARRVVTAFKGSGQRYYNVGDVEELLVTVAYEGRGKETKRKR